MSGPGAPAWRSGAGATLLSVGVSTGGPSGSGEGPQVRRSEAAAFARVKRSHSGVRTFLTGVHGDPRVREALVWSTCQRMELYGWIADGCTSRELEALVASLRVGLFGDEPPGLAVNVLLDDEARHHLLRTACGLNSDLPGDRDVTAQLETACRSARSAGAAGPRSIRMVAEAKAVAREVREQTHWGVFATGYCAAALARIHELEGIRPRDLTHVVIGGSTTSRSVLGTLRDDHGVPDQRLTVVFRGHHGQRRELRKAVGGGTALKTHGYGDEEVLTRVAAADVVYFGIDRPDPVFRASTLAGLRDFRTRPLIVLDFNSSGSIGAGPLPSFVTVWDAKDLDHAVAAHTAIMTARADFREALDEAEERIALRLGTTAVREEPC